MGSKLGEEIDGISCELDHLSRVCERIASQLTGKKGPRSNTVVMSATDSQQAKVAIALLNDMLSAVDSGVEYNWSSSFHDIVSKWRSAKATVC